MHPRRSHHHRSKRVVGLTLVEERTSAKMLTVLPGPRTRLHKPWCLHIRRAPLRRRRTDSVMVLAVPYVCWAKIKLVDPGALKTSMRANVPARVRHGRPDGIMLLLT